MKIIVHLDAHVMNRTPSSFFRFVGHYSFSGFAIFLLWITSGYFTIDAWLKNATFYLWPPLMKAPRSTEFLGNCWRAALLAAFLLDCFFTEDAVPSLIWH
jgi:hypothetical protein